MIELQDTISKYTSCSTLTSAFKLGKDLISVGNKIEIPQKLVFRGLYRRYKEADKNQQKQIRSCYGRKVWKYFQSIGKKLTSFVDIFTPKYSLLFLSKIPTRDLHNCRKKTIDELRCWWVEESKEKYPILPEVEELYSQTVLCSSPSAVKLFEKCCLGKRSLVEPLQEVITRLSGEQMLNPDQSPVSCPICLENFNGSDRSVILLVCCHGICSTCVKSFEGESLVQCPLCKESHPYVTTLFL